jgi:serine/threonine protein kinase
MNTPEGMEQLEELFHLARNLDQAERANLLAQVSASDPELAAEVESLIATYEQESHFIDSPAYEAAASLIVKAQGGDLSGHSINHYQVLNLLGKGGMGEVYRACDTKLNREVAIKVLPASLANDGDRLRRFEQEARATSALNHPNILTIHDFGTYDGSPYIIAELLEGEELRAQLNEGAVTVRKALDYAQQIAEGLVAAHGKGIIHRDLKPENLFITKDGRVKILDFGLAKLMLAEQAAGADSKLTTQANLTSPGTLMGTVGYMSPEQARGLRVDSRADIFTLGILLYEMIAGRRPFEGKTMMDTLATILNQEPPPLTPQLLSEAIPINELRRVVSKSLSKEPDERYQTAQDLLIDLKSLRQEIELRRKMGRSESSDSAARLTATDRSEKSAQASDAARTHSSIEVIFSEIKLHRPAVLVTAVVLVLALAVGGYWLYRLIGQSQQVTSLQDLNLSRLTSTGNIATFPAPAISPNGQNAVYVVEEGTRQSLWLKQVATNSKVEIIPTANVTYDGLTFSPDNNYIYYALREGRTSALYRVTALGGAPVRILDNIDSAITFSPDGVHFAFVGELHTTLMIADSNGKEIRRLISRKEEEILGSPTWSPDGNTIACAAILLQSGEAALIAVNVKDGTERPIGSQRWGRVVGAGWLANGRVLAIGAAEKGSNSLQLWRVAYPDGEARRITNDLSNYFGVSLTADAMRLISVRQDNVINLWVSHKGNAARPRQITSEEALDDGRSGIAWTPDGRIVYSSRKSGAMDLWIVDSDGGHQRQLTFNSGTNVFPTVSADGRSIVFSSDRDGNLSLWRMDIDGGNLKRLTDHSGLAMKPQCLPNSQQVVFEFLHNGQRRLWQVPIEGGDPKPLTETIAEFPAVSPDGKFIACNYGAGTEDSPLRLAILPTAGGSPIQLLNMPSVIKSRFRQWLPDGGGLSYLDTSDEVVNVWGQTLAGGPPKPLTDFKTDRICYFAWSRDGKQLACARSRITSDLVLVSSFQ